MSRHTERTTAYNTAYLTADRSQLAERYDLDTADASGRVDPTFDERVPPADFEERRRAVLEFYGHRCGRCTCPIEASDPDGEAELGYAFSVGRVTGADEPWALDKLVALCEPCFDLVDASEADALGRVATRFREAAQFPSWHCDPRVAVERAPLAGRELFRRELLADRVEPRFDFRVNDAVAEHAALALPTPATRAVAFGVELIAGVTGAPADEACPERAWKAAPPAVHVQYDRRTLSPQAIATGDRWARSTTEAGADPGVTDGPDATAVAEGSASRRPHSEG